MIARTVLILLFVSPLILLSGCVKIQIKPKDVVKDTVSAGQSLYETVKRKKDGKEERLYTQTVQLNSDADQQQVASACLEHLIKTASAASENDVEMLEQATEILNTDSGDKMKCTMRAVL